MVVIFLLMQKERQSIKEADGIKDRINICLKKEIKTLLIKGKDGMFEKKYYKLANLLYIILYITFIYNYYI